MSKTVSARLTDEQAEALAAVVEDSDMSRSAAIKAAVDFWLAESGEVPEHIAHDARIRQIINEAKRDRRRGKFKGNFASEMKASFRAGETPAEFRESVAGYLAEASEMGELPTGEDAREWCEEKLRYYEAAYQASEYDHNPREDPLAGFEGIETAREWADRSERIAELAAPGVGNTSDVDPRAAAQQLLDDGSVPEQVTADVPAEQATQAVVAAACRLHDVDPMAKHIKPPSERRSERSELTNTNGERPALADGRGGGDGD